MRLKKNCWLFTLIAVLFAFPLKAQVIIGDHTDPHSFSLMELSTEEMKGGLQMPQLTTHQRDSIKEILLGDVDLATAADGLAIYNIDNKCLEFWEKTKWVSLCSSIMIAPLSVVISPTEMTISLLSTTPLTATVTPANATAVQYKWEYSLNGQDWIPIDGQNTKIINAMALASDTWYRVTAFNESGSAMSNVAHIIGLSTYTIDNPNIQMYVGAFWRWNERGERIIQFSVGNELNNDGDWAAAVVWYDDKWDPYDTANPDGVTLAINSSPLSLPLSDMNAENHPVTGGSQFITGTVANGGTISFRIGLDKQFANYNADTNPARYAVVYLSCNNGNKKYKLFIRQGEGADYVMRPDDSGTDVPPGRPAAVKFSPYNLTDPLGRTTGNYNGAAALPKGGAAFTNYPTKAGYFFTYGDTKAIDPDISAVGVAGGGISGYNKNIGNTTNNYWDPNSETCPGAFRRPNDGANSTSAYGTGTIANSEIRQSLWENPPTDNNEISYSTSLNSTWGYYADGYFDRRLLMDATSGSSLSSTTSGTIPASAVAWGTIDVAYEGRLFFNPNTNASLFFPAGGSRTPNNGELIAAGSRARYWTSSAYNAGNAWFLYIYSYTDGTITKVNYDEESNSPYFTSSSKASGAFVRCVQP